MLRLNEREWGVDFSENMEQFETGEYDLTKYFLVDFSGCLEENTGAWFKEGDIDLLDPRVFLGGTCGEPATTWRQDQVIPNLKVPFFNPQPGEWCEEAQDLEILEKKRCDFYLFVLDSEADNLYSLFELGQIVETAQERLVFVFIKDFSIRDCVLKAYTAVCRDIKAAGGHVFETIEEAVGFLNDQKEEDK